MPEKIYTIPINDIFGEKGGCPFCRMQAMAEKRCLEFVLGPAMMEPDIRVKTNAKGFCRGHLNTMLSSNNRLSVALMLSTRIKEGLKKGVPEKDGCFVCERLEESVLPFVSNTLKEFSESRDFRESFAVQESICVPHMRLVLCEGKKRLSKKHFRDFEEAARALFAKSLEKNVESLESFCRMFDYRSAESEEDFSDCRNAPETAADFLSGTGVPRVCKKD